MQGEGYCHTRYVSDTINTHTVHITPVLWQLTLSTFVTTTYSQVPTYLNNLPPLDTDLCCMCLGRMHLCLCTPSRDCTTVPGVEPLARAHAHPNLRRCCEGGSRTFLGSDLVFREDTAGSLGGSGGKGTKWWQRTAPMHFTHRALRTILLHLLCSMAWSAVFPPSRPRSTAAYLFFLSLFKGPAVVTSTDFLPLPPSAA